MFGADDNFFNDKQRALEIVDTLARKVDAGSRPHCKIRWGTEATVHDTLQMKDHLSVARRAGIWALWLGVEDMTGALVHKGQTADKTAEAFHLLRENGIFPMPMLMHHDAQPLYARHGNRGLINQLKLLRKAGAVSVQVLMLVPAVGSKTYEDTFTSGLAYQSVDGVSVDPRRGDGNYVIASRHRRPWAKQLNLMAAYVYFYNPLRLLMALVRSKTGIPQASAETRPADMATREPSRWRKFRRRVERKLRAHVGDAVVQLFGMWGVVQTIRRTLGWTVHLMRGNIKRHRTPPASPIPMRGADGSPASHAPPETPISKSA